MAKSAGAKVPKLKQYIRPPKPAWPEGRTALAVAYSGGGFRASLAGVGMTRALADLDLLRDVRYTSSVSGGSWANALLALHWDDLKADGFTSEAYDEIVLRPFVETITTKSLTREMVRNLWRLLGPKTRSDLLADAFDEWFGKGRLMGDLSGDARFIFNSTNLNTGARFAFEQARAGDYDVKYIDGDVVRVADALAASAALPGALSAQRLRDHDDVYPDDNKPYLVDGAVYDNLGLEAFRHFHSRPLIVALDAGAPLRKGGMGNRNPIRTITRSSAVMQSQIPKLRTRWLVDEFRTWEDWEAAEPEAYATYTADPLGGDMRVKEYVAALGKGADPNTLERPPMPPRRSKRGVTFGLGTSLDPKKGDIQSTISRHQRYAPDDIAHEVPPWRSPMTAEAFRAHCAAVPMSAGKFDPELCRDLVYRGWFLTRETLRTFHPDVLTVDPPAWREWA